MDDRAQRILQGLLERDEYVVWTSEFAQPPPKYLVADIRPLCLWLLGGVALIATIWIRQVPVRLSRSTILFTIGMASAVFVLGYLFLQVRRKWPGWLVITNRKVISLERENTGIVLRLGVIQVGYSKQWFHPGVICVRSDGYEFKVRVVSRTRRIAEELARELTPGRPPVREPASQR